MALGDTYNNNEKKNYSPTVTSGYSFSHPESEIDKTKLYFSFWNKLLKISIAPKKNVEGDTIAFDYENEGKVYLSHTKALIFYKEIMNFLKEYDEKGTVSNSNVGVSTGKDGLIYLCDGTEFNANGPCLVIRKIDETGHSVACYLYEFRRNVHASVLKYDANTTNFESRFYDIIEIEQFANLLKEYYESMTMATAYSIQEANKYDTSRMNTKLKIIGEKLGVEFGKNNSNSRAVNSSYFSNAKPVSTTQNTGYNGPSNTYETGSLDDIG